jgi:pimeloyl-ACP methyl ester carboxylesterase
MTQGKQHAAAVVGKKSVELAYEQVPGPGEALRRVLFLPGIFGRGSNLRTLARRFLEARPGWDAWLLDLRGHGASPKGTPSPSLAAAAADVTALCAWSAIPVAAIVGHSFGGKVALEILRQGFLPILAKDNQSTVPLSHVMTLDSNPGPRVPDPTPDSAWSVLEMLQELPATFPSRTAFVEAVTARGHSRTLAQWLALSTEPAPAGGVRFALDLAELRALLLSYFAADLWPVVSEPPDSVRIHLVIGEHSTSYAPTDRARARELTARREQMTVDFLPTGHWVHTDDLDGLLQVMWTRISG